jgi:hypothetical protein
MKPLRILIAVVALVGLSACYTSKTDLVGDDAVTPFEAISFTGRGGDSKPAAFTREGNGYVTDSDGQKLTLLLKPIEGDYYVAQLGGQNPDGSTEYLYGYLRIDAAAKVADAWRIVGTKADARPGLSECDDVICIDDLEAYIAYAKEAIVAGAAPESTFDIVIE